MSRCPNFHCNGKIIFVKKFAGNSGAPALGPPLEFAHPAHPIATPVDSVDTARISC